LSKKINPESFGSPLDSVNEECEDFDNAQRRRTGKGQERPLVKFHATPAEIQPDPSGKVAWTAAAICQTATDEREIDALQTVCKRKAPTFIRGGFLLKE
jgi:hypothetical protein